MNMEKNGKYLVMANLKITAKKLKLKNRKEKI